MGWKSDKKKNLQDKMGSTDMDVAASLNEQLSHEVVNKSDNYVSFYQIAKEIAEEDGLSFMSGGRTINKDAFDRYRATRRRYLIEILKKCDLLEKYKMGKEFQIPLRSKETIKFLVRHYAQPLNKKVRQNKVDKITGEEAKIIIKMFEDSISPNMPEEEAQEKIALFSALTQGESRYALDVAMAGLKKMWENDIGNLTWRPVTKVTEDTKIGKMGNPTDKELRISNDCDAAFLIYYYYHLMLDQSRVWNQLVDSVNELRTEETEEIIDIPSWMSENENNDDLVKKTFRDINDVIFDAYELLRERQIKRLELKQDIPKEELKALEEIIQQHRKDMS